MRAHEIEVWSRRVIESAKNGQPNEDFRVELKSQWITPEKAARRIAAQANAARGELILWIIGVAQDGQIIGVNHLELATWYDQVKAQFDDRVTPNLIDVNFVFEERTVVALLFDPSQPPYVVKAKPDSVQFEVPWREGTSTRSAGRAELLKILSPVESLPLCEIRSGLLVMQSKAESEISFSLVLELYITPKNERRIVIPFHTCTVNLKIAELELDFAKPYFEANKKLTQFRSSPTEIMIEGPGVIYLKATEVQQTKPTSLSRAAVNARIVPANSTNPLVLDENLAYLDQEELEEEIWILGNPPGLKAMKNRTRNQLPARRRSNYRVGSW